MLCIAIAVDEELQTCLLRFNLKLCLFLFVLFLRNPCYKGCFCHSLKNCYPSLGEKVKKSSLTCSFYLSWTYFLPIFSPDGSRQAGTALRVGRANNWCILEFLIWIRRTLCWESSAQKDHFCSWRKQIFPSRPILVLNYRISCSSIFFTILPWVKACPCQTLSFLFSILASLSTAQRASVLGPSCILLWSRNAFQVRYPLVIRRKKVQCLEALTWAE